MKHRNLLSKFQLSKRVRTVSLAMLAGCVSGIANAAVLEELIVTAQKREQGLQDVSISVTAFSGDQLDALGITDTTEITQQVPGLQLNAWSPNVTIFNLRGISQNNFVDNLEAPVAVYLDDAYMGSINGISGQLFDMDRTEILRGPQGTLFGRNATGGLIHYVSKGADEEEANGYVEGGFASFDRTYLEFAAGGSFSDTVRGRIAGRWEEADGYIESTDAIPGVILGNGQDIGGADGYAIRGTLQIDFSDSLTGEFWLKYSEDDDVATGGYVFENCVWIPGAEGLCEVDANGRTITQPGVINAALEFINGTTDPVNEPADVHDNFAGTPGFLNRETSVIQAMFDYQMSNGMQFVSITNYTGLDKEYLEDGDASFIPIIDFGTGVDYTQFSQEFRLSGETDSARWQTGLYYLDIEIDGFANTSGVPAFNNIQAAGRLPAGADLSGGVLSALGMQKYLLDSRNWSIFGQVEFDLSDTLTLTTGLRWSQDDKDIDWQLFYTDSANPTPLFVTSSNDFNAQNPNADTIDYGDWAARIALDWRSSDTTLIFLSVNRGIKGGNWTISVNDSLNGNTFQHAEEVLFSYEAGFKTEFPDSNLRLNGTVYYYDYEDYQAFSLAGGAPRVDNTDASAYGAEVEAFWSPGESWDIILGASLSESEVDSVIGADSPFAPAPSQPILDAEFPNAPSFSANYLVRYNWNVGDGNIALQVDGAYYGDQFLEVTNGSGTVQQAYNVSNARISYTGSDKGFSVTGWVKNFTDEEYKVYSLDLGFLGTTTYYAPPVTYGVTAKYSW